MPSPLVLHLVRPYANAEEYLAREAWTIDTRAMVLLDQSELEADTEIAFDVTLGDGSRPIRAEARVIGMIAGSGERPGGLRVRFKRYGAATRAFVERAVAVRWSTGDAPPHSITPDPPTTASVYPGRSASLPPGGPSNMSPYEGASGATSRQPNAWDEDQTMKVIRVGALAKPPSMQPNSRSEPPVGAPEQSSGLPVERPPDREVLLERLRRRGRPRDAGS